MLLNKWHKVLLYWIFYCEKSDKPENPYMKSVSIKTQGCFLFWRPIDIMCLNVLLTETFPFHVLDWCDINWIKCLVFLLQATKVICAQMFSGKVWLQTCRCHCFWPFSLILTLSKIYLWHLMEVVRLVINLDSPADKSHLRCPNSMLIIFVLWLFPLYWVLNGLTIFPAPLNNKYKDFTVFYLVSNWTVK